MKGAGAGSNWATTAQVVFRSLADELQIPAETAAFTPDQVVSHAERHYDSLCGTHQRHDLWKNMIKRAMFQGIGFSLTDGNVAKIPLGKYILCPERQHVKFKPSSGPARPGGGRCKRKMEPNVFLPHMEGDSEMEDSCGAVGNRAGRRKQISGHVGDPSGTVPRRWPRGHQRQVADPLIACSKSKAAAQSSVQSVRKKRLVDVAEAESSSEHSGGAPNAVDARIAWAAASSDFSVDLHRMADELEDSGKVPREWLSPPAGGVRLSDFDRDRGLLNREGEAGPGAEGRSNGFCIRGFGGWRSVRGTHGVVAGDWYFEVCVLSFEGDGAVRIGWTTRRASTGIPVGSGEHGHGLRDRGGEYVHMSVLKRYGESFSVGDVIGCRIHLGRVPEIVRDQIREADLRWLDFQFAHRLQGCPPPNCTEMLSGTYIEWFKNGKTMGVPEPFLVGDSVVYDCENGGGVRPGHSDQRPGLLPGTWYPTISLFRNASVAVRFEDFAFPPPVECAGWMTLEARRVTHARRDVKRNKDRGNLRSLVATIGTGATGSSFASRSPPRNALFTDARRPTQASDVDHSAETSPSLCLEKRCKGLNGEHEATCA